MDYRKRCGVFGVSGLLYNHESPLRGKEFVTRKIALAFVEMSLGRLEPLEIGNLDAVRDWGYAEDFVDGFWRSLQVDTPDTYVFATGKASRVRDFIKMAAGFVGFDLDWSGDSLGEIGYDRRTGRLLVRVNSQFYRPLDLRSRIGFPAKARQKLGWIAKTDLSGLCCIMVDAEKRRNPGKA